MGAERAENREELLRDGSSTSPGTWSMARTITGALKVLRFTV